jgi:hypothetical protein
MLVFQMNDWNIRRNAVPRVACICIDLCICSRFVVCSDRDDSSKKLDRKSLWTLCKHIPEFQKSIVYIFSLKCSF